MKYILWIKNEKRENLVKKIVKTDLLEMIFAHLIYTLKSDLKGTL
jgi:hypothetical protein